MSTKFTNEIDINDYLNFVENYKRTKDINNNNNKNKIDNNNNAVNKNNNNIQNKNNNNN